MTETPPVVDGHNDALLAARRRHGDGPDADRAFLGRGEEGHLDLRRAREGGFAAGFFAAFVPNDAADGKTTGRDAASDRDGDANGGGPEIPNGKADGIGEFPPALDPAVARAETFDLLGLLHRWASESDRFRIASDVGDLRACLDGDAVGAIPHLEGAAAVARDCGNLDRLYRAGVRSIGLVWSRPNAFGHGVPSVHDATPDTGPGLTDAGRDLVRACNDRGILVDCAHLNAAGFWEFVDASDEPVVSTHTGAHAVCPATRNLTDEQLDAVAGSGGVVGLTFAVSHLRPDGASDADTPLSTLVDHVDHLVDRVGVDHVALGSDFDGARVPDAVGDVTGLPRLFEALRDRGYDEADRRKFAHGNWLRVLEETWR